MPDTGNTTHPGDPSLRLSSTPAATHTVALVLCLYPREPHREGEVLLLDPSGRKTASVGRIGSSFGQQLPGEMVDHGPLKGATISAEQLEVTAERDGARVRNVGRATVWVDGTVLPRNTSVYVLPGAVIEVLDHSVMLVTIRPLSLPPPHPLLLPLQPFGETDSMGFVGESPLAWQQREETVAAARACKHTAVYGETGTGKLLVARAIHDKSERAKGPFVPLNSPNLTGELAALQLFGGRKGWPNPGTPETIGYFQVAEGGTLLLDELGEISPALQAKLLGALERGYDRAGETEERPTRCVVILATNRGEAGIKEDLRMRCGCVVAAPSLAARREDISQIARKLLLDRAKGDAEFAAKFVKIDASGRPYVELDPSLMTGLLRGPIRGNVRELDNILGMSIDAARGQPPLRWPARLTPPQPAHLELRQEREHITVAQLLNGLARRTDEDDPKPAVPVEASFGSAEQPEPSEALLLETFRATGWNYAQAAVILKMTRDKVYRLRMKYGIERPV